MCNHFLKRYQGQSLGENPHITVLGSCKVGNFVITIPLLRLLRKKYPNSTIDFWGSEITKDFEEALCGDGMPISWRYSWDYSKGNGSFKNVYESSMRREEKAGGIDLLINCDGFNPLTQTLASWLRPKFVAGGSLDESCRNLLPWGEQANQRFLADNDWDSESFLFRYKNHFKSNYIAELFCRMAYLSPTLNDLSDINLPWKEPDFEVPDVLIHCTTARPAKLWPLKHWDEFITSFHNYSLKIGIIGASPKRQRSDYHAGNTEDELLKNHLGYVIDLRGKTNLIELAGASKKAKAVISLDAGPMHISAGVGTPTLAIVGNDKNGEGVSPIRLWLPRSNCLDRTISSYTSTLFSKNNFKNDDQAEANRCMQGVEPNQVTNWLKRILGIK